MLSQLFLVASIFWAFPLYATDNVSGDFSGQPLEKVLAEIARIGGINIVGDFSEQKVPCARFSNETYYEEAFNLVAKTCALATRRIDNIWLVFSADYERRLDKGTIITKYPHYRSPSSLQEPLRPFFSSQVKTWFPPRSGIMAMFGSKEYTEELKKAFETLDTPVHSVQIDILVKKGKTQATIASASFVTLSWRPFRLKYSSPAGQSESFDWQGLLGINDDGILHGKLKFEADINGKRALFSHELSTKDQQWVTHDLNLADTRLTVSLRGTAVAMPGHIFPASYSTDDPELSTAEPGSTGTPNPVEIPHRETTTLKKPLIFSRAPIAQVIEQLAAMEKIPITCDAGLSGVVSVYCYGQEVNLVDLIAGVAAVKGYEVFPYGEGLIAGEAKAIQDMLTAENQPYISETIQAFNPASASQALLEGFKELSISGSVKVQPENSLTVKADKNGLRLAGRLGEIWAKPMLRIPLGVQALSGKEVFEDMQPVSLETSFDKTWKTTGGTLQVRLSPTFIDPIEGLSKVNIALERKDNRQGNWSLHCTSNLPGDPAFPLFSSQGNPPLKISWKAAIASKAAPDDYENAFDTGF